MVNWKKFFAEEDRKDDDLEIEFYDKEENTQKKSKLKKFFATNDNNNNEKNSKDGELSALEDDNFVEEEVNENLEKFVVDSKKKIVTDDEIKSTQKGKFLEVFKTLFSSDNKYDKELQEDEVEDYKTYLEQKKKEESKNNNSNELDIEFANDKEENQTLLCKVKSKINNLINYGITKEDLPIEEYNEEIEIKEEYKNKKKGKFLKYFMDKKDEDYDNTNDIDVTTELEKVEYKEISEDETENNNIKEKLNSLGIETENIKDINLFEDRENARVHPTLASMKVKRILQDKNIENLATDLVFESPKDKFKEDLLSKQFLEEEKDIEENKKRESKNKEDIDKLQKELTKIERKEEKIDKETNYFKNENNFIDKAIKEINDIEEIETNISEEFKIEEGSKDKARREKINYTTIDDVLKDSEEILEDDIDKTSKILVVNREQENVSEEIVEFRDSLNEESNKNKDLGVNSNVLDTLIFETETKNKDDVTIEIEKLEENLELLKNSKQENNKENIEEISVEKVAKDGEINYPDYDEIKKDYEHKNIVDNYSDYALDIEEVEELMTMNKIESESEKVNIDSLNKEFNKKEISNDIDIFRKEKTYIPTSEAKEELKEKISYKEKLYLENVKEYFIDEKNSLSFGEYKTLDRGYRPVSKEKMESNRKKLDEIFAKYNNIATVYKNSFAKNNDDNKIGSVKSIGKFKPSPVYSSVYGEVKLTENKKSVKDKSKQEKVENKTNLFKEIASQDENVWNIDINSKLPQMKKTKKKK